MTTYQSQSSRNRQLLSTLAAVTAANPVLLEGEKWNEKDASTGLFTGRTKTGKDGVVTGSAPNQVIIGTAFNDLPFDPVSTPLSDSTPQPLGTAAPGTSTAASRSDHRHASVAQVDWKIGNYVSPVNGIIGTSSSSFANFIYLCGFIAPVSFRFDELAARVATAVAGSSFQLALYSSSNQLPAGLPIATTASISGAVAIGLASGANGECTAGELYFMACNQNAAGLVYQTLGGGSLHQAHIMGSPSLGIVTSSSTVVNFYRQVAAPFDTWPDLTDVTTTEVNFQRCPVIFPKIEALL